MEKSGSFIKASRSAMSAPGSRGGGVKEEASAGEDSLRPETSFAKSVLGASPPPKGSEGGSDSAGDDDDDGGGNEWGFSSKQLSDLQEAYNVLDTTRDDTINPTKLYAGMRALGLNPTEAEVQDLINAVDEDGNGTIEFEEFCEMMQRKIHLPDREDELKEAFKVFDRDEDGAVSLDDMSTLFSALGMDYTQDEMREMLLCAGGDEAGVSYDDFVKIAKTEPRDFDAK